MKVDLTADEMRRYREGGFESLLNRFNRAVQASGMLTELKKRQYYKKPSVLRNEKKMRKRRGNRDVSNRSDSGHENN